MKLADIVDDIKLESASKDFLDIAGELADHLENELEDATAIQKEIVLSIKKTEKSVFFILFS